MDIRMLGPLEVVDHGRTLNIGGPKQRALCALLAINANQVVSIDRLIDELWGENPPPSALRTLRSQVARLRRVLEPDRPPHSESKLLVSYPHGYELLIDPEDVDSQRFEAAVTQAKADLESGDPQRSAARLRSALGEWRGSALSDLSDYEFARIEATRLEGLRLAALEGRLEADLQTGRAAEIVSELEALVEEHPYREGVWRRLMLALYQTGRQADALRAYQSARKRLGEDLGVEPGPELEALEERILFHDESLVSVTPRRGGLHNFPSERTSFVGRDRELLELADLLGESRCVTITGMGGAGKTRLALRLASVVVDAFPDGVYLVELAPISDPELVLAQVADALGVLEGGCEPIQALDDALTTYLRRKKVLIVLDNSEHLLDTTARLVERLLDDCGTVTLLVTSRQRLAVAGETVYRLLPLALPPVIGDTTGFERYEAVQLFEARARSVRADFHLTADNIEPVLEICRRLDGIPLAIELAAARVNVLTPHQIASRLGDSIASLGRAPGKDPRHQTLLATMEWSYRLLAESERKVLDRLSVFSGAWDIDALEAVIAPEEIDGPYGLDALAALVDKSLVVVEERNGRATYHLLDTVRRYAADRLAEQGAAAAVERRHAEWMLNLVRAGEEGLRGPEQLVWMDRLDLLSEELEVATNRLLTAGELAMAAELVGSLGWYWYMNGNWKGARRWVDICIDAGVEGLDLAQVTYKVLGIEVLRGYVRNAPARILAAREVCREAGDDFGEAWSTLLLSIAAGASGEDLELSKRLLSEVRAEMLRLGDQWGATMAGMWLGTVLSDLGDPGAAQLLRGSLDAFLRLGDGWSGAECLFWIGQTAYQCGDYDAAESGYRESVELARRSRNGVCEAHAQSGRSNVLLLRDDVDQTEESLLEARELFLRIGDDFCSIATIARLGRVAFQRQDYDEAQRFLVEAVEAADAMGNRVGVALFLVRLASVSAARGDVELAGRLLGASEGFAEEVWLPQLYREEFTATLEETRARVGGERLEAALAAGREKSLAEAVGLAVSAVPRVQESAEDSTSLRLAVPIVSTEQGLQIVLFTDIEGSTLLADAVGDARAQELRRIHDSLTRKALSKYGGVEIKHTGDGFMASFRSVVDALKCSVELHRSFAEHNRNHPATPIRIRAGLNAGEPVAEDGDLFGMAVNLAARICDAAAPGQILVSNLVREVAAGKAFTFVPVGDVELKGIAGATSLFAVVWEDVAHVADAPR